LNLHEREVENQQYLLDCTNRYGPVFKAWQDDSIVICVTGLQRIKRLMSEKEEVLRPISVPVAAPFPKGLMRVMEGTDHARYRGQLNTVLQAADQALTPTSTDTTIIREFERLVSARQEGPSTSTQLTGALNRVSCGVLLQMYFGLQAGSKPYEDMMQMYTALGPEGYVMQTGPAQQRAFERIRLFLSDELKLPPRERAIGMDSILGGMINTEGFDDVSLGNLIYMVEIGRYDMTGLFRWMLNYAAQHPKILDQLSSAGAVEQQTLALAFVNETLRLNQIERLLRSVREPFVFNDFYFPRHAIVRLCLWESHKAPDRFAEPFRFDPQRFTTTSNRTETLPFGVGLHRCPMASYNLQIATLFIRALATSYRVTPITAEAPFRSRYHWEPARNFNVRICRRTP
jgi:cytochrome P450